MLLVTDPAPGSVQHDFEQHLSAIGIQRGTMAIHRDRCTYVGSTIQRYWVAYRSGRESAR